MKKNQNKPLIPPTKKAAAPKQRGNLDLKKATDIELQAAAYRESLLMNHCQANIQNINNELAQRAQQGRAVVRPEK